ncbi:MAG TPA: D-alanyl-D-alanine carboxypeptidase/D-alanyl-D-alanine-endopeptidase [Gaiellales bacterium]|jgi:D-alanyl-D-alanine carboxypeptidase/D-alanyl-D-alanine-endopeptidase (penicillin-binding protein 4)
MVRRCTVLLVLAPLAVPCTAGASVGTHIASIVARSPFGGSGTGIAVYDTTSDRALYRLHSRTELKPASNMKLTTAAVVLADLGAGGRLRTRVYATGTVTGGTLTGSLWLVGGGDPSLSTGSFRRHAFGGAGSSVRDLATAVRHAGIRRVSGRVFADETLFDTRRTGPYWKPSYWQDCPPISALSVNEDLVSYFRPYSYHGPAVRAAEVLRTSLKAHGVRVDHDPRTGKLPAGATLVATERSPLVGRLVKIMDRRSDNYFAEVLNKRVAVEAGMSGTMAQGRREARRYLKSIGVGLRGARLYDGSGLSPADRLSARQILRLLRRVGEQPYADVFRASLPVAGVNGTLSDRMESGPAHANAQAKTGTLDDASNLSGYVRAANGHRLVFSILVNGPKLDITAAHRLQDRIVQALAGSRPR